MLILSHGSDTGYADILGNFIKIGDFCTISDKRYVCVSDPDVSEGFKLVATESPYYAIFYKDCKNSILKDVPTFFQ